MLLTHPENRLLSLGQQRYRLFVLAFLSYVIAAVYSIYITRQPGSIAGIWYANASIIMFLQVFRYRDWTILLALAAAGNICANILFDDPIRMSLAFIPGNLLEIGLSAFVIRRFIPLQQATQNALVLLKLLVIILLPIAGSSIIGALVLNFYGLVSFGSGWVFLFTGSVVGAISIFPIGIILCTSGWNNFIQINQSFRFFICILMALLIALFGFVYLPDPYIYISATLILVAFIGRFSGTAVAVLVYSVFISTLIATGFFQASLQGQYNHSDSYLYLPLMMTLIQPLLLAAALQRIYNQKSL